MTTIKRGSQGEDVKTLQRKLNLYPDGIFGPLTEEAVKEFQKAHNLTADGIVGAKTWAAFGITYNPRNIKEIIVHCSATPDGEDFTVGQIREWHLARGFSDVGYHYVIYRDGSIHTGRPEAISGAHCLNHNTISIGICYIGGCNPRSDKDWQKHPKYTRTAAQKLALVKLIKELKKKYPNAKIYGHRDFANRECPSFDAKKEYMTL